MANVQMPIYPSNSNTSKEKDNDRNKKEPVAKASHKPPSVVKSRGNDILDYVIHDVIIPVGKDMLLNAVAILLGREPAANVRRDRGVSRYDYNRRYRPPRDTVMDRERRARKPSIEDLMFDTRGDAERVLDRLCADIEAYGFVPLSKFYDYSGYVSDYTDENWGWVDLYDAEVIKTTIGKYMIRFPRLRRADDV